VVLGGQLAKAASEDERRRMLDAPIFARISPEQKLELIARHQERGAIVAMTGDGVNDAPALKKADIGVAMGKRGTEVARQASDIVLRDDAFATIVAAVQEGRIIFGNIRTFVLYLLSCNLSEILVVGLASAVNAPLPILPLQILFLNLVTDVFPALALGVGEGSAAVMTRPPRDPRERLLEASHWRAVGGWGLLITAAVLGALAMAMRWLDMTGREAVSVSFLTLAFAQLWHVFNMRSPRSGMLRNEITANPWVWGALALCAGLLLAAVFLPGLSDLLQVVRPGPRGWLLVAVMSAAPLLAGQLLTAIRRQAPAAPGTALASTRSGSGALPGAGEEATMRSAHERFWENESYAFVGHTARRGFPTLSYGEMRRQGRKAYAVDPSVQEIGGDRTYPDLASLPEKVDAVVLEVPPEETAAWVGRAADAGIRNVWIHMGRDTPEALALAEARGLHVVTGTCAVMYVKPGFSYHTLHKWVNQLTGRY